MDLESVKRYLEQGRVDRDDNDNGEDKNAEAIDRMPTKFFESFNSSGLKIDLIEPGRVICSMKVPTRLSNSGNFLHGGSIVTLVDLVGSAAIYATGSRTSGVSMEINVSYMDAAYADEEIEIDAKSLRVGKTIAAVAVEFRNKKTGKVVAQGRHTKYLVTGKL